VVVSSVNVSTEWIFLGLEVLPAWLMNWRRPFKVVDLPCMQDSGSSTAAPDQ